MVSKCQETVLHSRSMILSLGVSVGDKTD